MGCSCKQMDKIQRNLKEYDSQSGNKLTEYIIDFCKNILNRGIFAIIFIICTPIICLILLINLIFRGKLSFPVTRLNKVNANDLKNELEKIS